MSRLVTRVLPSAVLCAAACADVGLPERNVAEIRLSRDSAVIEVGDTAVFRAEPRDANGAPIVPLPLTWSLLTPGLVNHWASGVTAQVVGGGAGAARLSVSAGLREDTATIVVLAPATETTLERHLDSLDAIGAFVDVAIGSANAGGPRGGRYQVQSRTGLIFPYLASPQVLRLEARGYASSWVVVTERHGSRDSIFVVVQQRPASIQIPNDRIDRFVGRTGRMDYLVRDRLGAHIPNAVATLESRDPGIVAITSAGEMSYVSVGQTTVVARFPSGAADSIPVVVLPPPNLFIRADDHIDDFGRTATGMLSSPLHVTSIFPMVSPWVRLVLRDTSIAHVPDSVNTSFRVAGKRLGSTYLVASSPAMATDSLRISVSQGRLLLQDFDYESGSRIPIGMSGNGRFHVTLRDSVERYRDPIAPLTITIVSRDPSVVALPQNQSPVVTTGATGLFHAQPVSPGQAWVVASAPGLAPDSLLYVVRGQAGLSFRGGPILIGAGQNTTADLRPPVISSTYGSNSHPNIPITFTQLHPEFVEFPGGATLVSAATWTGLEAKGLAPGTDTIVATAPALTPDTMVVIVSTPRIIVPASLTVTGFGGWTDFALGDSTGRSHKGTGLVRVKSTPSDTTILRPSAGLYDPAAHFNTLFLSGLNEGVTSVRVADTVGLHTPATMSVRVVLDETLQVIDYRQGDTPVPREVVNDRFVIRSGGRRDTVFLQSTNPAVLKVDSFSAPAERDQVFAVRAGDQVGTARFVASARGFRPDTSPPVAVTPGKLSVTGPEFAIVGQATQATLTLTRQRGNPVRLDSNGTFTWTAPDGGIEFPPTVVINAGTSERQIQLRFTAPGSRRLVVEDRRPVPVPFAPDTLVVTARLPRLDLAPGFVGVGQRRSTLVAREGDTSVGLVATVSRLRGRTRSADTVLFASGSERAVFAYDGVSLGIDTIIAAAPGYAPDTNEIGVTDGVARLDTSPLPLRENSSRPARLTVTDPFGQALPVVEPTTFVIAIEGPMFASGAMGTITTITIPAGSTTSPEFTLNGVVPGTASVRFLNLHYLERTFSFSVVP